MGGGDFFGYGLWGFRALRVQGLGLRGLGKFRM